MGESTTLLSLANGLKIAHYFKPQTGSQGESRYEIHGSNKYHESVVLDLSADDMTAISERLKQFESNQPRSEI